MVLHGSGVDALGGEQVEAVLVAEVTSGEGVGGETAEQGEGGEVGVEGGGEGRGGGEVWAVWKTGREKGEGLGVSGTGGWSFGVVFLEAQGGGGCPRW